VIKSKLQTIALAAVLLAGTYGVSSEMRAQDATGPCADYAAKLCEKAGPTSQTCANIKSVTGLMPAEACDAGLNDLDYSYGRIAELAKKCKELEDKLCADIGEDTKTCKMVRSKVPGMPPEQCTSMMTQYPKVLADLKKQEEANKPLSAEKQKAVATGTSAVFGDADAKVTVVEFSDFQCPYCSRAAGVTTQIKAKYPNDVRFVFRQFPLSFHKHAHLAAEAALAAAAEGKFWQYHDLLFKNQKALTRADLEKYAKEAGLDEAAFKKALDDGTYKKVVDDEIALGNQVAVRGTPTMFVNGARVGNPTSFDAVSAEIDKAIKAN